jgi:iron complex outermembrane receptor protein
VKRILPKRSVIAVALTLPVSPLLLAQEAADKPIPKVVVTGSNIARIESSA